MRRTLPVLIALVALRAGAALAADAGVEPPAQGPPTAAEDSRIDINAASVDELVQLSGVGPSRAQAIIDEREKRRFRRIEDIMRVPGIGRKTFARIRHSIRVR